MGIPIYIYIDTYIYNIPRYLYPPPGGVTKEPNRPARGPGGRSPYPVDHERGQNDRVAEVRRKHTTVQGCRNVGGRHWLLTPEDG